jgi:hypothetical protein
LSPSFNSSSQAMQGGGGHSHVRICMERSAGPLTRRATRLLLLALSLCVQGRNERTRSETLGSTRVQERADSTAGVLLRMERKGSGAGSARESLAILAVWGQAAETCSLAMRQVERLPQSICTGCRSAPVGDSSGLTVAFTRRWRRGCSGVRRAISTTPRFKSKSRRGPSSSSRRRSTTGGPAASRTVSWFQNRTSKAGGALPSRYR